MEQRAKEQGAKELRSEERRSDSLFIRVGIEEKTSNSFFSSCFSPFMSKSKEQIALIALLKRRTKAIHSFALKKPAIHMKTQRESSQPCTSLSSQ